MPMGDAFSNASQGLTLQDLMAYIQRDPRLAGQYTPVENFMEFSNNQPNDRTRLMHTMSEMHALGDPFGARAIGRMLGVDPGDQFRLHESHGLANKERRRLDPYRPKK